MLTPHDDGDTGEAISIVIGHSWLCYNRGHMPLDLKHYKNRHSLKSKALRVIWNVTWLLLFRPTPRGNLFRPWRAFLLRCFGAKLAKGANVLPSCRIWQPWKLEMGAYSCLSERVDCYNADWIRLGDQVTVSQDAFLCTASHDISSPIMELTTAPLTLGNQCWVCARAVLLPGVTLGEGAVVAASAVVTKDVPAWTVVGGNPANKITLRELAPPPPFWNKYNPASAFYKRLRALFPSQRPRPFIILAIRRICDAWPRYFYAPRSGPTILSGRASMIFSSATDIMYTNGAYVPTPRGASQQRIAV